MVSGQVMVNAMYGYAIREKCRKNIGERIFIIGGMMDGQLAYLLRRCLQAKHGNLNGNPKDSAVTIG